jgi:hypothetical protein
MAAYVPVPDTDPNFNVLHLLSFKVKKYIVTWQNAINGARAIFGVYKTQRQAFVACREASNRSAFAFPLCFLSTVSDFFKVVGDNVFVH